MKQRPIGLFLVGALAVLLAAFSTGFLSTPAGMAGDLERLQGDWDGHGPGGECSVTISGNSLNFRARADFWYETTFTLPAGTDPKQLHATIVRNSLPQQSDIGKVVVALFKIEDGTLTLGVIDDFEGPLASPVATSWDKAIDRYHLKKVQPQENKSDNTKIATMAPGTVARGAGPQQISFPTQDGGVVSAHRYGEGDRAVVLAHGGRFDKESWATQAKALADAGFRVIAIDFRGYGQSRGPGDSDPLSAPLHLDVLAAVRYLRDNGATSVSVVGGSMGGTAAAQASVEANHGEVDRLVLLAAGGIDKPMQMQGRKLFITAREDLGPGDKPRLPRIQEQFDRAPEPKELVILEGAAHAQYIFDSEQGERLLREILRFLTEP
jgi:pimeloyl-ACP methyl ester carboxylesterase